MPCRSCPSAVDLMTSTEKNRRIRISKDGPYLVYGGTPLSVVEVVFDDEGTAECYRMVKQYPKIETYSLCRCGQSRNKPYCDGTHAKIGFVGTETASLDPFKEGAEKLEGPNLILYDNRDLCVGARFCHRAGGIWDLTERSNDQEARKVAEEIAASCPSGRLVVCDRENGKPIEPKLEPSIQLIEDRGIADSGPIWVRGGIPIESADGTKYKVRNRVTLCRCGRSENKPFCDGSHLD